MSPNEYEHTGAPPNRGYKGRRVKVVDASSTHVFYVITKQLPNYRTTSRVWRVEHARFLEQYALVKS